MSVKAELYTLIVQGKEYSISYAGSLATVLNEIHHLTDLEMPRQLSSHSYTKASGAMVHWFFHTN